MVNNHDRERASAVLSSALDTIGKPRERWLLKLLQGGDTEHHIILRNRREAIGGHLSWKRPGRRVVPDDQIPNFVVDSLGLDILRFIEIRFLLIEHTRMSNSSNFSLLVESLTSYSGLGVEASVEDLSSIEIGMGTKIARDFCRNVGLPMSFSTRGSRDDRLAQEVVQSSKTLPDLVDFQERVKSVLSEGCLRNPGGRGLVVMPTGSGKTRTMIESVLDWIFESQEWPPNIVWIADREELCEQAFQSFKEAFVNLTQKNRENLEGRLLEVPSELLLYRYWGNRDIPVSIDESGHATVPGAVITSVQQLQAREKGSDEAFEVLFPNSDFVIVDEAHRNIDYVDELNCRLKESKNNPRMVGLTATPMRRERVETATLMEIFDSNIICPIEGSEHDIGLMVEKLTEEGILARRINLDPWEIVEVDHSSGLNQDMAYQSKTIQLIDHVLNRGASSVLVFTRVVEDSRVIASYLRMRGDPVNAEHLESGTPIETRRRIIQNFRDGEVRVLLNFGILTTGFDAPKTDAVLICRPQIDEFESIFQQMVGRGLRGPRFGGTENCIIVHLEDY